MSVAASTPRRTEDPPTAAGDYDRYQDAEPGIGRRPTETYEDEAAKYGSGHEDVRHRVAGISRQHLASQLPCIAHLGRRHPQVHHHRRPENGKGDRLQARGRDTGK